MAVTVPSERIRRTVFSAARLVAAGASSPAIAGGGGAFPAAFHQLPDRPITTLSQAREPLATSPTEEGTALANETLEQRRKAQLRTLGTDESRLREERGISQKDLALYRTTDLTHPSRVESGQKAPSVSVLLEVADILEVPVADLFDDV